MSIPKGVELIDMEEDDCSSSEDSIDYVKHPELKGITLEESMQIYRSIKKEIKDLNSNQENI